MNARTGEQLAQRAVELDEPVNLRDAEERADVMLELLQLVGVAETARLIAVERAVIEFRAGVERRLYGGRRH